MARTTVDNTIQRIRRQAAGGYRNETNILQTTMDASTTTIALVNGFTNNIQPGALLCLGIEVMRVIDTNPTAKTCTVLRGWYDSDAAAHTANDEVWINPRYSPVDIYDAMIAELHSWGPALYTTLGATSTVADGDMTYELPTSFANCYGIIAVRRNWTAAASTAWPDMDFRFQRGVGTTWTGAPTSGLLIRFLEQTYAGSIYVVGALPYTMSAFSTTADLITDVGLSESQLDVLELGVKLRMGIESIQPWGPR
jgi:hypothetical protein